MSKRSYLPLLGTQCADKVRYVTTEYAETKCQKLSKKYGKPMYQYYCGICRGYHLTSRHKKAYD